MANINPSINSSLNRSESTLRDTAQSVKESVSSSMPRSMDEAQEMASEFYDNASTWLQQNYGIALGGLAVLLAAGVAGYFIGKNASSNEFHLPS